MQAIGFYNFGGADLLQLINIPIPHPGDGEVVVRVAASTINPTDIMMLRGDQAALMTALTPPYIAGMEFAGHVYQVSSGADLRVGTPVMGVINPRTLRGGAHSQFICVSVSQITQVQEGIDLVAAATVPMNALTAMRAIEIAHLSKGQVLLVTGATGLLGGTVVQLARLEGLTVVANAKSVDEELLRDLGADVIVPRDEGLKEVIKRHFPDGVDCLIDGALIGSNISSLVREGGAAISLRRSHQINDPRLRCDYVSVIEVMGRTEWLQKISHLLSKGLLRGRIADGGVFEFRHASDAFRLAESGLLRGRVVLTFDD
jgi:NADPH:quinone reductase